MLKIQNPRLSDQIHELLGIPWLTMGCYRPSEHNELLAIHGLRPLPSRRFPIRPSTRAPYDEGFFRLAIDIKRSGLKQPILITRDLRILDGVKRVAAFRLIPYCGNLMPIVARRLAENLDWYTSTEIEWLASESSAGKFDQLSASEIDDLIARKRHKVNEPPEPVRHIKPALA